MTHRGRICFKGNKVNLSQVFAGQNVEHAVEVTGVARPAAPAANPGRGGAGVTGQPHKH